LDEAFGLAVGFRGVGFGEDVPDPSISEELGDGSRSVGGAIVTHEAFHLDAEEGEVGESLLQEDLNATVFFIGKDLGIGDAGGIVDGHMDVLPASAPALIPTILGNPMAGSHDASELLDVDMQEFSGILTLESILFGISQGKKSHSFISL
jgi:hypothetical protein